MTPDEAEVRIGALERQVKALRVEVRDHAQRLDTAQTDPARRLWWWVRWGWPLYDWNADRPRWRPWNRDRRPG